MDDFLHNLRTGNNKKHDRRRPQDGNRFSKPAEHRNSSKDKRKQNASNNHTNDQFNLLKKAVDSLAESQRYQTDVLERQAEAEERKVQILEQIAEQLPDLIAALGAGIRQSKPVARLVGDQLPALTVESDADRDQLVMEILRLREKGASYDKIARLFEENDIPTLSGRGKWRGQTIFRLYNKGAQGMS